MRKAAKVLIIIAYAIALFIFAPVLLYPISSSILHGQVPHPDYLGFWYSMEFDFRNARLLPMTLIFIGIFCVLGIVANMLMNKDKKRGATFTGGEKFLWVISYAPYAVPLIILMLLWLIIKFIDIMVGVFTGGEKSLKNVLDFILEAAGFKKKTKVVADGEGSVPTYTILGDGGHTRTLTFAEKSQDYCSDSPYHLKYYDRFIDDLGNYWRSYDGNDTFIPEKKIPGSTSYIG